MENFLFLQNWKSQISAQIRPVLYEHTMTSVGIEPKTLYSDKNLLHHWAKDNVLNS